jgi:glycolate oxidase FAD binding subunit
MSGGGTRLDLGRPVQSASVLSVARFSGITNYDPSELVMAARAGTPLEEIEAALAENNQMLTFEPMDHRALLGASGEPTIGGVFAGNISGPRRISAGAARDNLLGVRFVNGSGEIVKSGGRVMKNVTGLDLVKLMAGSWGTLGVICEVIFKVLPRPETAVTIVVSKVSTTRKPRKRWLRRWPCRSRSPGRHICPKASFTRFADGSLKGGPATVLRLEGLVPSVEVRTGAAGREMRRRGTVSVLEGDASEGLWRDVRDVTPFADGTSKPVWKAGVGLCRRPPAISWSPP